MRSITRWVGQCLRKRRYSSMEHAEMIAANVYNERGVHLRSYSCPHCNGWHLTKMPNDIDARNSA